MKAVSRKRLNRRLWRAFIFQIVLISATAAVGVYLAEFAIRELLIVSALKKEANYFWARRNIEGDTAAPNTHTLIGYLFDANNTDAYPEEFKELTLGIHEVDSSVGHRVVYVSEDDDERLYLIFDADNVRELATYFGVVPLALMLIVLYSSAWFAYRLARRAVSPVIRLARSVRNLQPESDDGLNLNAFGDLSGADDEIITLSHALNQLVDRINQFVDRERSFTRETSHELRSPLTVIRIACDVLLKKDDLSDTNRSMIDKISRSAKDMEELTHALLLLAREHESGIEKSRIDVNEIIANEISRCEIVYGDKPIEIRLIEMGKLFLHGSPKMLAVVLGNLIRNACGYTERGNVTIRVDNGSVIVEDSGIGISDDQLDSVFQPYYRAQPNNETSEQTTSHSARESGHGIGLSLVKRLTDRFGWPIEIQSQPNVGTVVRVSFPVCEFEPRAAHLPHQDASAG